MGLHYPATLDRSNRADIAFLHCFPVEVFQRCPARMQTSVLSSFGRPLGIRRCKWLERPKLTESKLTNREILGVVLGLGLPVSRYWKSGPGPRYWARLICTTSLHILIDLGILGIPIPWIYKLDTPRLYRNLLFGIFFLGLL